MSAKELARKKKIRAGHRGCATRAMRRIDTLLAASGADEQQLAQLKLSLEEKLETLKQLDGEVLDLTGEDDLETEIQQSEEFKDEIYSAIVKLNHSVTPVTRSTASTSGPMIHSDSKIKLPKLTIPPFEGDITKWTPFWDSYDSAIHRNSSLTEIDKFNYLRSLLRGTARESVAGLMLTAVNYDEAIAILKKRYGNKQAIISRHMDTLMGLEAVVSNNNTKALRHLYDMVESNIRSLRALGVAADSYGNLLSPILVNKLPNELRLIIGRKIGDGDWELETILKELVLEIEARERTSACATSSNPPTKRQSKEPGTAATLLSKGVLLQCCFCNQQHPSERCQTVKSPEDRRQSLMRAGRCFRCLARGHLGRQCKSKTRCNKCNGRNHHCSICNGGTESNPRDAKDTPTSDPTESATLDPEARPFQPQNTALLVGTKGAVLLQTASVHAYDPERPEHSMTVRAILDTGSQQSYVSQRVKDTLALKPSCKQTLSVMTFSSNDQKRQDCEVVRVGLATRDGKGQELELFTVPFICQPLMAQPIDLCTTKYKHLADLDLADTSSDGASMNVDLLIGSDCYWTLVTGEIRRGDTGPVAVHTRLGWVLSGVAPMPRGLDTSHSFLTTHVMRVDASSHCSENLDDVLHSFWKLESLGIEDPEDAVLEEFNQTVHFNGDRYEVALPWKDSHPPLPSNFDLSSKRLQGLLRRLKQDPDIMSEYNSIIQSQLQQGIVEEVSQPSDGESGQVHYLPHHAVVRKDKETTKVRIVYDASAKSTGCSLNECLHKGPKFDQKILDILLRFRTYRIAMTADIEKAFLMVSVAEEDRDVLRFLWVVDVNSNSPQIRVLRFARVVFGVSSSPFLLNATLQHHLGQYMTSNPEVVGQLLKSMYVDDVISGAQDEQQAELLYLESKKILKDGGFNLRKFVTNSDTLQQQINASDPTKEQLRRPPAVSHSEETYSKSTLGVTQPVQSGEQKVLGVRWEVAKDQLCFGFSDIAHHAARMEPTKRNLVSVVGKFYDPIGFLSPIVIKFKILFQDLCEGKNNWDQPLTGELLRKWEVLVSELQNSPPMTLPRCIWTGVPADEWSASLHGFCDASKHAYAAVVYLVIKTPNGPFVRFIASKTRVAPLKTQTIPRLELLSALLLARLAKSITDSVESDLSLEPPTSYTDSKVSLYWILGVDRVWKQFVQRRVTEIRTLLPSSGWRHCPGVDNPADLPSRGLSPIELACSELWAEGPKWLGSLVAKDGPQDVPMPEDCAVELRVADRLPAMGLLVTEATPDIDCKRYSSMEKLLRVTARVLMFVNNLKNRTKTKGGTASEPATVSGVELLARAETLWIKIAQKQLPRDNNLQKQFDLFLDEDGIWRCGGRLSNADVPFHTKHPILLPRDHHLATLVVRRAHNRVLHNGVKDTLAEVRARYWILKGRAFVKKVIHQCVTCRKFEVRPCLGPSPPPLPEFRLREDAPFTNTGVDFAGPLYVKGPQGAASNKVWICLYTCCVIRAVHLDVVPDMTTTTFIRSLKRFAARRGLPKQFVSDNGKTFKAAAKVIETIVRHQDVQHYLSGIGVEWLFNLERAPWWGGVFERMVRMTKRCLKKMVGRAKLSHDELVTAVIEVEAVINSRPLTYMSSGDLEQPLTPAHLICGRRLLSLPDAIYLQDVEEDDFDVTSKHLTKRFVYLNRVLGDFWKRWRMEYLLELRDSHRHTGKTSNATPVGVGDVVLVHDEGHPRGFWKLARIKSLVIGKDGRARGAVLRVASTGNQESLLQRPLQRLYPLEIRNPPPSEEEEIDIDGGATTKEGEESCRPTEEGSGAEASTDDTSGSHRPRRAAAQRSRDFAKTIAIYEQEDISD